MATCLCVCEDSVPETPSSGTELTLDVKKGILRYATHFQKHSVLKTGFWGTEGKFGTRNTLLRYEVQFAPSYGTVCIHSEARCTRNHLLVYGMKRSDATVV